MWCFSSVLPSPSGLRHPGPNLSREGEANSSQFQTKLHSIEFDTFVLTQGFFYDGSWRVTIIIPTVDSSQNRFFFNLLIDEN